MKMMTNPFTRPTLRGLVLALAVTVLSSYVATATPYATCVTNSSGTIHFRLNENAGNVKIIHTKDAVLTTNDLGALGKGLQSVSLTVTSPFWIQVTKSGDAGYLKGIPNAVSADTNRLVNFANTRGVAVNFNPASPFFGRIYVACGSSGTVTSNAFNLGIGNRSTGDGMYVLNADQTDALGQGDTALTGGIDWSLSAEGPHRINVGEDDNLYICDWSDAHGGVFVTDPDVSTASGKNVLVGNDGPFPVTSSRIHGSAMGVVATGSRANNNLTVYHVDEDLQLNRDTTTKSTLNTIWRWDIGGAELPYSTWPPVQGFYTLGYAAQLCDLKRGPDGKFYYGDNRADPASSSGAFVLDTDATTLLWSSVTATRAYLGNSSANDLLNGTRGIAVSPNGMYMATINGTSNSIAILPLINGIPNMTNIVKMGVNPTTATGRGVTFDAAGNIYSISSGQGLLRIYSPGGLTVATTGSDGTFAVTNLMPIITLAATQPNTSEDTSTPPGVFTISRTGDTTDPITVTYAIGGTATNGVDYSSIATSATIPATASSVDITVTAIPDSIAEPTKTVMLTLSNSPNYILGSTAPATVYISDTNTPVLSVSSSPSMYERVASDYAAVTIARNLGNTNVMIMLSDPGMFTFGGTAVMNVDYVVNSNAFPIYLYQGDRLITNNLISPIDNSLLDGNRTVVIGISSGTDGNGQSWVGATNLATTTIIDDEVPTETVLWSDNFNVDSSANYTVRFGSGNSVDDYTASFAVDYSGYGVPAAPHSSGDTLGLGLNVNKLDSTALGAAGVNLYPKGKTFSGNYALRFDMYLFEGSASGTTEYSLFGINHDGAHTNWFRGSVNGYTNSSYDGIWDVVESDASDNWAYLLFTAPTNNNGGVWMPTIRASQTMTAFPQVFKSPPFGVAGAPANVISPSWPQAPTWADVELAQVGNLVTLRINHTLIYQYANTVAATNGNIMLGYDDAYDSIGNSYGVIYDNVRVVQLFPPTIVTQPASVVAPAGGSANFTVVVSGSTTGSTNYQWRFNGVAIVGATNATLALNNVQLANYGAYTVVVSDGVYSVTSVVANLLVLPSDIALGSGTGLEGGYWTLHTNSAPFTGSPTLARLDSTVNFDWGTGSPDSSISADYFTARWVGQVQALSSGTDTYTFTTISDDGSRLWVNGQLVVDAWVLQGATPHSGTIALSGTNKYDIVMEYFEQTGNASAQLCWSNATTVGYSPVPQSQLYPAASVLPAIALTSPADGASYSAPATINLAVSVTTNQNVIQYVAFYNGATLVGSVTNSPYQYSWSNVTAGSYNLTAQVVYNANWTVASATNKVTVTSLNAPAISGISGNSLNYSGGVGSQFVLLKTADLSLPRSAWTRDQTNTAPSGSFIIPVGSEARAFYTIKSE